jgi:UDP-N-acetylglucosamine 1-carboxyvinyltransferase
MDALRIVGQKPLHGSLSVSGAKNAALPLLCASLLTDAPCRLRNVPRLRDIDTTAALLGFMGRPLELEFPVVRAPETKAPVRPEAPYELVRQMRASVCVLGPLLAKHGRAQVSLPGGCAIGARPIDQHLKGLEALGASIEVHHGYVHARASRLVGAEFVFDVVTVTGTENVMMAAALAEGRTTLVNCAREPEVEEVARVLNQMGARVTGAGTSTITIEGQRELGGFDHPVVSDRIEAGTYLAAVAGAGGNVLVRGAPLADLEPVVAKLRQMGVAVEAEEDGLRVVRQGPLLPTNITTSPHPGFPTDMQAQLMAVLTQARGRSVLTETIFENRFMHVPELARMGARIAARGNTAIVDGVELLSGANVMATDLRASASLVIAALMAEGESVVRRVYHLDRGYERLEAKLSGVGASVERFRLEGAIP